MLVYLTVIFSNFKNSSQGLAFRIIAICEEGVCICVGVVCGENGAGGDGKVSGSRYSIVITMFEDTPSPCNMA